MVKHINIDMERTGAKLKCMINEAGYDVKYIQKYLNLLCPQPVYRGYKGKVMPSLEHLYTLSVLLGVHMEELIIIKNEVINFDLCKYDESSTKKRVYKYYCYIFKVA